VKTVATIEARMASARLPGKVLAPINGRPLLAVIIQRVRAAREVDQVVVATTGSSGDDAIQKLAEQAGVGYFRGSEQDVMGRVLGAARAFGADNLVALTGDNPLVDPRLIDDVIAFQRVGGYDYVTTTHMHHSANWKVERTFPVGVSVQVMTVRALADAAGRATDHREREYASFAIYDHPERYRLGAFEATAKYEAWRRPELRLTVDTPEDLDLMRQIFDRLSPRNPLFSTGDAIRLVAEDDRLQAINRHISQRKVFEAMLRATQA